MSDSVDLRSDTVTRPGPEMRRAVAEAEVGDDVLGADPTVLRLQDTVAELLGKEAALFVPSGTMANQIALKIHTHHGDEVLVGRDAHNWLFESGAAGAIAGVQPCLLHGDGRFTAAEVRAANKVDDHHHAPTRLVTVENTHNMGGGLIWDPDRLAEVLGAAAELSRARSVPPWVGQPSSGSGVRPGVTRRGSIISSAPPCRSPPRARCPPRPTPTSSATS